MIQILQGAHCGAFLWAWPSRLGCSAHPPGRRKTVIPASGAGNPQAVHPGGYFSITLASKLLVCHCASQACRRGQGWARFCSGHQAASNPANCRTNGAMAMSARAQCSPNRKGCSFRRASQRAEPAGGLCAFIRRVAFWIARGVLGCGQGLFERAIALGDQCLHLCLRALAGCSQLCMGRAGPAPTA